MKVQIRKTLTGTEYWDTEAKKTLFVPNGEKPKFEVTKDPESMIGGVDFATGKDKTVVIPEHEHVVPTIDDMNKEQLLTYAADNNIEIPGNIKKEDTIRKYIADELNK